MSGRDRVGTGAELDPEDAKLEVLARAARVRTGASEGAAVRDSDGRTYSAATVSLPSLRLSALQAAVVLAAASGVTSLEAAVLVSAAETPDDPDGLRAVRDLSASAIVYLCGPAGSLVSTDRGAA